MLGVPQPAVIKPYTTWGGGGTDRMDQNVAPCRSNFRKGGC